MTIDWQSAAAIGAVVVSAGYLGFRAWVLMARKRSGGCGTSCGQCGASPKEEAESFVSIDELTDKTPADKSVH